MGRPKGLPTHCTVEGCDRIYKARGLCDLHYRRQREGLPADADLLRGEASGQAKLTEQQVQEMKHLRAQGETLRALAEKFGVSNHTVHRATTGKQWKHLD